jgi:hypothetical protein
MNIASIRAGLKTRLATITGLRCYEIIPDQFSPPAAIVGMPTSINFDFTYQRATDRLTYPVRLLVAKATDRSAQERLEQYLDGSGSLSVKAAIEGDPSLGGAANVTRVLSAQGLGVYDMGGVSYLGCDFTVEVIA